MYPFNKTFLEAAPTETDDGLRAQLQCWPGIAPDPAFEASVWRRIRMEQRPAATGALAVFAPLRGVPAWSMAMAATGLLVFGMWIGATMFRAPRHGSGFHPLLHPNTVAGAYLSLSAGGVR